MPNTELRDQIARAIDDGYDDYLPVYSEAGECIGSNLADAILPLVEEAVAAERERCVRIVEGTEGIHMARRRTLAAAIRTPEGGENRG